MFGFYKRKATVIFDVFGFYLDANITGKKKRYVNRAPLSWRFKK